AAPVCRPRAAPPPDGPRCASRSGAGRRQETRQAPRCPHATWSVVAFRRLALKVRLHCCGLVGVALEPAVEGAEVAVTDREEVGVLGGAAGDLVGAVRAGLVLQP